MRIKDIAEMAGVSNAMVSRVINNSGYVAQDKRRKIEEIIRETGFQLNQQARSLRTKKTGLIASVVPALDSSYIIEVQQQLIPAMEEKGYHLLISTWRRQDGSDCLISVISDLVAKGVDGIVLFHDQIDAALQHFLLDIKTPLLIIDEQIDGVICLLNAQKEAGYLLCRMAASHGYHRIAYLDAPTLKEARGVEAFARENPQYKLDLIPIAIDLAQDHSEITLEIAHQVLTHKKEPEILLSFSDRIAMGTLMYAQLNQSDLQCAGIGNTRLAYLKHPPLPTVDLHSEQLVGQIVATMDQLVKGQQLTDSFWRNTCTLLNENSLPRNS